MAVTSKRRRTEADFDGRPFDGTVAGIAEIAEFTGLQPEIVIYVRTGEDGELREVRPGWVVTRNENGLYGVVADDVWADMPEIPAD